MSQAHATDRILSVSKFISVHRLKEEPLFYDRSLMSLRSLDDGPKDEKERKHACLWVDIVALECAKQWIKQDTLTDESYVFKQTPRLKSMTDWTVDAIKKWLNLYEKSFWMARQEINAMRANQGKHLMPLVATSETVQRILIDEQHYIELPHVVLVLPYYKHSDLFTQVVDKQCLAHLSLDDKIAQGCTWLFQLATALDLMHSQHWIHRDIKPENIFWTPDGVVLADFGYAAQSTDWSCLSNCEGTIVYMAPEVARKHYAYPGMSKSLFESKFPQHKNYLEYVHSLSTATTTASDIYSLGVTMFCLMFQRLIHHEHGKQSIPFVGTGLRVQQTLDLMMADAPKWFTALLSSMLAIDPRKRPTARQILTFLELIGFDASSKHSSQTESSSVESSSDDLLTDNVIDSSIDSSRSSFVGSCSATLTTCPLMAQQIVE